MYLTTKGRKTGRDREIEIWFTEFGGCSYVISEKRDELIGCRISDGSRAFVSASETRRMRAGHAPWMGKKTLSSRGAFSGFRMKNMGGARDW